MTAVLTISLFNDRITETIIIVEPWAEEIVLPPQTTIEFGIYSDKIEKVESSIDDQFLTIWLWQGCTLVAFIDGEDVTPASFSIPVP
jgi:hypothetical protein